MQQGFHNERQEKNIREVKDMNTDLFDDNNHNCPWYRLGGECEGKVYYNCNINDDRYGDCHEDTCPIFYWVAIQNDVKYV